MRLLQFCVLILAFLAPAEPAHAQGHFGIYPDKVYAGAYSALGDCELHAIGEKPLWHGLTNPSYIQQIRFSFNNGHGLYVHVVDFAQMPDGRGIIEVKLVPRQRGARCENETSETHYHLPVSAGDAGKLSALAERSGSSDFDDGSWDGKGLYMHCETLDMERVNARGYSHSSVNWSCSHPKKLAPFVDYLAKLAKLKPIDGVAY